MTRSLDFAWADSTKAALRGTAEDRLHRSRGHQVCSLANYLPYRRLSLADDGAVASSFDNLE